MRWPIDILKDPFPPITALRLLLIAVTLCLLPVTTTAWAQEDGNSAANSSQAIDDLRNWQQQWTELTDSATPPPLPNELRSRMVLDTAIDFYWMEDLLRERNRRIVAVGNAIADLPDHERRNLTTVAGPDQQRQNEMLLDTGILAPLTELNELVVDFMDILTRIFIRSRDADIKTRILDVMNVWVEHGITETCFDLTTAVDYNTVSADAMLEMISLLPPSVARTAAVMRVWHHVNAERNLISGTELRTNLIGFVDAESPLLRFLRLQITDLNRTTVALQTLHWALRSEFMQFSAIPTHQRGNYIDSLTTVTADALAIRPTFELIARIASENHTEGHTAALWALAPLLTWEEFQADAEQGVFGLFGTQHRYSLSPTDLRDRIGALIHSAEAPAAITHYLGMNVNDHPDLVAMAIHWLDVLLAAPKAQALGTEERRRPRWTHGTQALKAVVEAEVYPSVFTDLPIEYFTDLPIEYSETFDRMLTQFWSHLGDDSPLDEAGRVSMRRQFGDMFTSNRMGHLRLHQPLPLMQESFAMLFDIASGDTSFDLATARLAYLRKTALIHLLNSAASDGSGFFPLIFHVAEFQQQPTFAELVVESFVWALDPKNLNLWEGIDGAEELAAVAGNLQLLGRSGILSAFEHNTEYGTASQHLVDSAIDLSSGPSPNESDASESRLTELGLSLEEIDRFEVTNAVDNTRLEESVALLVAYRRGAETPPANPKAKAFYRQLDGFLADVFETKAGRALAASWHLPEAGEPLRSAGSSQVRQKLNAAQSGNSILGGFHTNDVAILIANARAFAPTINASTTITRGPFEQALKDAASHLIGQPLYRLPVVIEQARMMLPK